MSMEILIRGRSRRVDLRKEGDRYVGVVEKRPVEAEVHDRGPNCLVVRLGERTYEVTFESNGTNMLFDLGSRQVALEILDPLAPSDSGSRSGGLEGRREIRASMPGKVVAVKVKVGDTVALGQGLLILEAMKMENEVVSPRAGTVKVVGVEAGQTVEMGALLAAVE